MDDIKKLEKIIQEQAETIKKLEKQISNLKSIKHKPKKYDFSNPNDAVKMLIDRGFFNTLRSVRQIQNEAEREGHNYSLKNIDKSLRNEFVKKEILLRIPNDEIWKYIIKK